jgi:flagellar basal body-associated protein FliL
MDKSKMMMGIIIALLVLLVGTVLAVTLILMRQMRQNVDYAEHQPPATTTVLTPAELRTVSLDLMTANLLPGPNNRSDNLLVEVVVGLNASDPSIAAELEEFYTILNRGIPIARSVTLDVFVERAYEEVITLEGRQEAAEIIKTRLQEAFGSNLIVDIRFPQWNAVRGQVR